jgi:hypothetical protein
VRLIEVGHGQTVAIVGVLHATRRANRPRWSRRPTFLAPATAPTMSRDECSAFPFGHALRRYVAAYSAPRPGRTSSIARSRSLIRIGLAT